MAAAAVVAEDVCMYGDEWSFEILQSLRFRASTSLVRFGGVSLTCLADTTAATPATRQASACHTACHTA